MNNVLPAAPADRNRWPAVLTICLVVIIVALTAYASYSVYTLVRRSVATSIQQPSFAVLSKQAGLNLPSGVLAAASPAAAPAAAPAENGTPAPGVAVQPTAQPTPSPLPPQETQERVNILLLGMDQRQGEQGPFRTDTMIVLTVDPATGETGMLSIPRDLWVPIPGYGENRINTANFMGDAKKYPGGGPALAKKTITHNFGFPVHYYVRLNFEGFKRIIDTIGGVDIDVKTEIRDDLYPDEQYGYDPLYIPVGRIHMNGDLALKFARSRHTDSDFNRASRQQQVIVAVKDKVLDLNLLPSLLPKLPELSRTLADAIQTDMPLDEMLRLAMLARTLDLSKMKQAVIDRTMTVPYTTEQGAQVLLPVRENIRPLIDEMFWSALPAAPTPAGQ